MQWKCIALCEAQPWCINSSKGNQLIKKRKFRVAKGFFESILKPNFNIACFEWCNRNVKQSKWHALRRSFYDGINRRVHSNLLYGDVVVWQLFIVLANEMLVPSGVFSYHGTWEYVSFEVFPMKSLNYFRMLEFFEATFNPILSVAAKKNVKCGTFNRYNCKLLLST